LSFWRTKLGITRGFGERDFARVAFLRGIGILPMMSGFNGQDARATFSQSFRATSVVAAASSPPVVLRFNLAALQPD
jgi:hypothetical protein